MKCNCSFSLRYAVPALLLAAALLLGGCGKSAAPHAADNQTNSTGSAYGNGFNRSSNVNLEDESESSAKTEEVKTATFSGRKLIRTVTMSLETAGFDTLIAQIKTDVAAADGYLETSDISGSRNEGLRSANLTIRIPAKAADAFLTKIGTLSTVQFQSDNSEDVTLSYADTESRIKALRAEQTSLLRLLEQAENLDSIIALQSQLTNVRYELESYESQLRLLDNQIEYTTISLSVTEVQRESAAGEEKGVFATIGANLSDNFYAIGQGATDVFVWFVSALPYLVLLAILTLLVLWIVRAAVRKHKKVASRVPSSTPFVAPTTGNPTDLSAADQQENKKK